MPVRLTASALSLFLLASTACAQNTSADPCVTAQPTCPASISTHATASTRLPSTAADVSVSILVTSTTLADVQRQMGQKSQALLGWLRSQNISRLVTDSVSFTPQTKTVRGAPDRIVGYEGTVSISFRTTPEKAPEILSGVLDHGANTIDSTSFTPTEEDIAAAQRKLAAEATTAAVAQGDAIATAAGMHMAGVRSVSVENGDMPRARAMPMMDFVAGAAAPAPPPIATAAGEQALSVRVDVVVSAVK